jgi:hypothetical protein
MDKAAALAVIRELAPRCSYDYVAGALNRRGIPSGPTGPKWNRGTVYKLARAHGIRCTYAPTLKAS